MYITKSSKTTNQFINELQKIFGNTLIYTKINYINSKTKVEIICPQHGSMLMIPNNLLGGHGCKRCASIKSALNRDSYKKLDIKEFIKRSKEIYGFDRFNYSKCIISDGRKSKAIVICKIHGEFITDVNSHLSGKASCPNCSKNKKKNLIQIIEEFNRIHHNFYDYSKFVLVNTKTKGIIVCPKHGEFYQSPEVHKRGCGCPICSNESFISKKECKWLDEIIKLPKSKEYRQKEIFINGQRFVVDGFNPITNTVYEFYGDYWHGNPKKFNSLYFNKHLNANMGYLYNKTIERESTLNRNGFKVVSIWELDYNHLV